MLHVTYYLLAYDLAHITNYELHVTQYRLQILNYKKDHEKIVESIYNEYGELEYSVNLYDYELDDIDVVYGRYFEPYGIIKLYRNDEKTRFNGQGIQSPESKL